MTLGWARIQGAQASTTSQFRASNASSESFATDWVRAVNRCIADAKSEYWVSCREDTLSWNRPVIPRWNVAGLTPDQSTSRRSAAVRQEIPEVVDRFWHIEDMCMRGLV